MTLNGRNEINKNSGADQKNFNEDRPMSVVAKCSGGSRKKYLGGLAPHYLGGNHG